MIEGLNMNTTPELLLDYRKSFTRFIELRIIQEDRRPDFTPEEAKERLGYKYKTQMFVRFFWFTASFVGHSMRIGSVFVNGKEI